jgi:hypothetical protein
MFSRMGERQQRIALQCWASVFSSPIRLGECSSFWRRAPFALSEPMLHDGRLLTLDDTVEYFNVILGTKLTPQEKKDLVDLLCAL